MTIDKPPLFIPGARVAIRDGHRDEASYREGRVAKVYKNGNFILEGDASKQQWSPSYSMDRPSAYKTGRDAWSRGYLYLWTAEMDAEIREAISRRKLKDRWLKSRERLERLPLDDLSAPLLDAIESALDTVKQGKKEPTHGA